jgi:23S rRNA pseudouridine1911/1915/1917 synthase
VTTPSSIQRSARVPSELYGRRLDQVLVVLFPEYSRSRLQRWLRDGRVRVDGTAPRAKDKVKGGERVELNAPVETHVADQPQALPLDIVYEDEHVIVINKPPGLVVHPAAGNRAGTLLNALLHHAPELAGVPRAGIVHRLDKDTSGLLVVARTLPAQTHLIAQLQARSVSREYDAIVLGVMVAGGTIEAPMGRHPIERKRMAVRTDGREAITHFRVVEKFRAHTHVRVQLETGRTHQIRVHMAHIRYPIVGDKTYGGRVRLPPHASPDLVDALRAFPRQALHASRLALDHPATGKHMQWRAALPDDMKELLALLREDAQSAQEDEAWD